MTVANQILWLHAATSFYDEVPSKNNSLALIMFAPRFMA